jgi:ABC-2 type transport system permease protein
MPKFRISIYFQYFLQFLKARLGYKADFITSIVASIFTSVTGILFVFFLLDGEQIKDLGGWKREEVFFIYGYSFMATALFSVLSPNLYQFGDKYIIQGQFDRVLLRPLNTLAQVLFESFNIESIGNLIVGLFLIHYSVAALNLEFSMLDYLWLLVSALSGAVILLSVFVTVASLSFHFEDRLGVSAPVYNLINFGRYPLPIFNKPIQFILSWIIPFGFVAFYPATHFFARKGFETLCYMTPLIAVTFSLIALVSWNYGVSKYASTGS